MSIKKNKNKSIVISIVLMVVLVLILSWNKIFSKDRFQTDLNNDNRIDSLDLAIFLKHYSEDIESEIDIDFNNDNTVNALDLGYVLSELNRFNEK